MSTSIVVEGVTKHFRIANQKTIKKLAVDAVKGSGRRNDVHRPRGRLLRARSKARRSG